MGAWQKTFNVVGAAEGGTGGSSKITKPGCRAARITDSEVFVAKTSGLETLRVSFKITEPGDEFDGLESDAIVTLGDDDKHKRGQRTFIKSMLPESAWGNLDKGPLQLSDATILGKTIFVQSKPEPDPKNPNWVIEHNNFVLKSEYLELRAANKNGSPAGANVPQSAPTQAASKPTAANPFDA